MQFLSAKAR